LSRDNVPIVAVFVVVLPYNVVAEAYKRGCADLHIPREAGKAGGFVAMRGRSKSDGR
jgi:hypothetical protein